MSKLKAFGILFVLSVLMIVQISTHFLTISLGIDNIVANLTIDDSYYYLETAWRTPITGFVTFDGINQTNGVQFLWFGILMFVRQFAYNKEAFLHLALHLCLLFNLTGYLFIYAIGKRIHPMVIVIVATLWLFLTGQQTIMRNAMESSAYGLIFWVVIYFVIVIWEHIEADNLPPYKLPLFAFILSLLVWARVDGGLYAIGFFSLIIWKLNRHHTLRQCMRLLTLPTVIAFLMGSILIIGFYLMGGSPIPVSGIIKSHTFNLDVLNFNTIVGSVLDNTLPGGKYFVTFEALRILVMAIFLTFVFLVWMLFLRSRKTGSNRLNIPRYLSQIGLFTVVLIFIHVIYLSLLSTQLSYTAWYYVPIFIAFIITVAIFTTYILLPTFGQFVTWVTLSVFTTIIVASAFFTFYRYQQQSPAMNWHVERKIVATWLSENLPSDTVLAAWNAGELAYFSTQPLINLDGLINSYDYYEDVLSKGHEEFINYLKQNHVEYIIDYNIKVDITPDYVLIKEFQFSRNFLLYQLAEAQ